MHGASLFETSSFGTMLNGQMDSLGAADPLAALTATVQNGTPISTVVSTLAGQVADAVQRQLPAAQLGSGASRTQIVDSVKAALSPPSNAPPGTTAAQESAALARRLQTWLNGVAREAERAGQQSDTSGQVLDATRARELPAQHEPEATTKAVDVPALTRSLIASVVAALPASPPGGAVPSMRPLLPTTPSTTSAATSSPAPTAPAISARAIAAALSDAVAPSSTPSAPAGAPANAPANVPAGTPAAAPANAAATAASTGQNPTDLLARMLVRAAGVDAQVNGASANAQEEGSSADAPSTPAAAVVRPPDGGGTTPLSPMSADRLTALLAEAVGAAAETSNGDGSSSEGGTSPDGGGARSFTTATTDQPAKSAGPVTTDSPAFAVPVAPAASASPNISQQPATSSNAGVLVDPNAIVEQVVKGMSMRSGANGTSEMHLRLEPEQLGTVTLKLTVDGTSVSATAIAQNADVRSALMSQQHQLARSLSESGLKLTSFSVDLSGGDTGRDPRDRTAGFGRHYTVHEVPGATDPDSTESLTSGPPLLPGSTVALFNYLA